MVTNLKAVLGAARNCGAIFVIWDFRKTITAYCAITAIVDEARNDGTCPHETLHSRSTINA
jgi:hypothetical protein